MSLYNVTELSNNHWYNSRCTVKTVGQDTHLFGEVRYYNRFMAILFKCFCIGIVQLQDAKSQKVYFVNKKEFNALGNKIKLGSIAVPNAAELKNSSDKSSTAQDNARKDVSHATDSVSPKIPSDQPSSPTQADVEKDESQLAHVSDPIQDVATPNPPAEMPNASPSAPTTFPSLAALSFKFAKVPTKAPSSLEIAKKVHKESRDFDSSWSKSKVVIEAIKNNDEELVRQSLSQPANMSFNVLEEAHDGYTFLEWAAKEGNLSIVKLLVESGAKVSFTMNHTHLSSLTVLHSLRHTNALLLALQKGHYDIAEFLLDHGANPTEMFAGDLVSHNYPSLPTTLAKKGNLEGMKLIYSYAEDKKDFERALYAAYKSDQAEVVAFLLAQGVKFKKASNKGEEALFYEVLQNFKINMLRFFIENGFPLSAQDPKTGLTALHCAAVKDQNLLAELIDRGADARSVTKDKINFGYFSIDKGADYKSFAKQHANGKALARLAEICKDIALHDDSSEGQDIDKLSSKVTDVNLKFNAGNTILHYATKAILTKTGRALIEKLLSMGAVQQTNNNGKTPLSIAVKKTQKMRKRLKKEQAKGTTIDDATLKAVSDIEKTLEILKQPFVRGYLKQMPSELTNIVLELATLSKPRKT